jgi:hypothetical protein
MNYTEKQIQAIIENLEFQSERRLEAAFDDFLDDLYGNVRIGPYTYATSEALSNTDPTAYRCGFADWLDGEIRDGVYTDEIQGEYYQQYEVDELLESIEEDEV